jgi:flagellar hook-associated protein 3 FlgL
MRISDVSSAYSLTSSLQNYANKEADLTTELTTGKAVDELQDDSSLSYKILNSQVSRESLIQYNTNAESASNIITAETDTLGTIDDEIDTALSVAESGQEDSSYSTQIDKIIKEITSLANTTYGGEYLFAGTASGSSTAPYTLTYDSSNNITGVTYNGSGDGREISVSDGVTVNSFATKSDNQNIVSVITSLVSLRNAISSGDSDAINTASDSLSDAQDALTDVSSTLSSTQARIQLIETRNSNDYSLLDDSEESATNADENETTTQLLAAQNAYSAALQCTSIILDESLLDYM